MESRCHLFCKIKKIIILLTTMIVMTGCYENDDFAPYTHYIKELNEIIYDGEVISLSDVIPYTNEIAGRYADELMLTRIIFITKDSGLTGDIQFFYAKVHKTKNQATSVKLSFDIESKSFYSVEYEQGHGKRVSVVTEQINDKYLNMEFQELFALDEIRHEELDKSVEIDFIRDDISVSFIDAEK